MTELANQISDGELRTMLRDLLSAADADGRMVPQAFWQFVGLLACRGGITDGLQAAGLEALREVPASPASTSKVRLERAYHIALLHRFFEEVGTSVSGGTSIFPPDFNVGAILGDLGTMLGGEAGTGAGDPQILNSARGGEGDLRRHARHVIVGAVRWRMGRHKMARDKAWWSVMGDDADISKLGRWERELGKAKQDFLASAHAAGVAGDTSGRWAGSTDELARVIKLANEAQGNSRPKL